MSKKQVFYLGLFASIIFLSSGFSSLKKASHALFHVSENVLEYYVPSETEVTKQFVPIPFVGKTFIGFCQDLAFKESQGKYHKVNTLGYLGKYQFGTETLRILGIKDSLAFLRNRKLQEKAFLANLARNKYELLDEIEFFNGKKVNGIEITESGLLAAAHLGGAGSVKRFLKTNGARKCKDKYGTSVANYLRDFSGYDTAHIIPDEFAKARNY